MAHLLDAGDQPARLLEIISPAGFERYFEELVDLPKDVPPNPEQIAAIAERYGLELDFASIPVLCQEQHVRFEPAR